MTTTYKNDEKILLLKKQIEEKKAKIEKNKRFNPVTNCILTLKGQTYNLNVLTQDELKLLYIELDLIHDKMCGMDWDLSLSGYPIIIWLEDIQSKLSVLQIRDEVSKLKTMEQKLSDLLSDDKKIELEINAIEEMLS